MADDARVQKIITLLKRQYPNAKIVLNYGNPWELLVAVVLSAQCTDVMVNRVTEKLFKKYPTFENYVTADLHAFEQDIKSTGFYRSKAKNILAAARLIKEKFSGKVPRTMEELLTVPGVARKTANVILGNAYGVVEGIAVDTHVLRLSQRLRLVDLEKIGGKKTVVFTRGGLATQGHPLRSERVVVDYKKDADPVRIERQLMAVVPKEDWFQTTYLLIAHGRAICRAQNPDCSRCVLNEFCPASRG